MSVMTASSAACFKGSCSNGNFVDENTVAVNIRRLRQKVEDNPSEPEYIKNIRGVGYTFAKRCIKK